MKKLKFLSTFLLVFIFLFLSCLSTKAAEITTKDDSGNYYFTTKENIKTELYGVTWNKVKGASNSGNQSVNLFSMKTDGVNSKLVTWSVQYGNYRNNRVALTKMAENYEKNHQGWKVVAGINADQWYQKFGNNIAADGSEYFWNQPYYPLAIDGERRFVINPYGNIGNAVGITNNQISTGFIDTGTITSYYLEVLNEAGEVVSKYPVQNVNETPAIGNTAIWISYVNSSDKYEPVVVNSDKDLYIVSKAEFAYMSNSRTYSSWKNPAYAIDTLFARGVIDSLGKTFTLDKGQFVIESTNNEVTNALAKGSRIRVQYYYQNEDLNNCEAITGYHIRQRLDGKDITPAGSYNTSPYPRSVFGCKADGTYVLMTGDSGSGIAGLKGWEINAFLKQNNVVTAYQDDGGGSVTAIWRNAEGGFDVVNVPRDGAERANLTGLFFVVKDVGFSVSSVDAKAKSLTINLDTSAVDMTNIKKIYCTLNKETKEVVDGKVTFENLTSVTEYKYNVTYDTASSKNNDGMLAGTVKTGKIVPVINDLKVKVRDNVVTFTPSVNDPDEALEYIRIVIDGERYPYLDEPIVIEVSETVNTLNYTFTYCYDLKDGKEKVIIEEPKSVVIKEEIIDPIVPEKTCTEDPTQEKCQTTDPVEETKPKKGCKKNTIAVVTSLITIASMLIFFKKRKF